MKQLSLQGIRDIQLRILHAFDEYCIENHLKYSLSGGTLLGAVRHKGYIPWDDDIDVMMPREDYMRLLNICNKGIKGYSVKSAYWNRPFHYTYIKVIASNTILLEYTNNNVTKSAVYIDVFPIDGLPNEVSLSNKHFYRMKKNINRFVLISMAYGVKKSCSFLKSLAWLVLRFLYCLKLDQYYYKKIENSAQKYSFKDSDYVGCIVAGYGTRERISRKPFSKYIRIPFESNSYSCISGYNEYLTALYGDYLKLPPKEEQKSNHNYKAYAID